MLVRDWWRWRCLSSLQVHRSLTPPRLRALGKPSGQGCASGVQAGASPACRLPPVSLSHLGSPGRLVRKPAPNLGVEGGHLLLQVPWQKTLQMTQWYTTFATSHLYKKKEKQVSSLFSTKITKKKKKRTDKRHLYKSRTRNPKKLAFNNKKD